MAKFRYVYTSLWTDGKVIEEFTPEDKLFFLYLLTNEHTKQIGVYQITKKHMAFELGYSPEVINALMQRFLDHHKLIRYNEETREIAIRNWGRYNLIKAGKPIMDCVRRELEDVKDTSLLEFVVGSVSHESLKQLYTNVLNGASNYAEPSKQSKPKDLDNITKRDYIILRDGQRCFYTGLKLQLKDIELDHINPQVNGGGSEISNLVVSYNKFNNLKSGTTDLREVVDFWNLKHPEIPVNYETVIAKINTLKEFEYERAEANVSITVAVKNEIYDTYTLRNYLNTIRGQKEKQTEKQKQKENKKEKQTTDSEVGQSVSSQSDFARLVEFTNQNITPVLPTIAEHLGYILDDYKDVDLILAALQNAVLNNARNKIKYAEGTLINWRKDMITTYQQLRLKMKEVQRDATNSQSYERHSNEEYDGLSL
ncbi:MULTISPECIES: DnaD domain protein [Lysinibacillus]|uniref:DnaD domain protein n=1 Tax=Lysinibacillus capsici TaxID=2115968 RepID=A0ABY8KRI2_9BACI|nr:DnaD domain protein [Lysinibacillus capsici]WGF40281.1 DnaD domain protein [Lysinibacillus capsici]